MEGYLIVLTVFAVAGGIWLGVVGIFAFWRWLIAFLLTPGDHRRVGSYKDTKACTELEGQGYGVTPDWHTDAVARIKQA